MKWVGKSVALLLAAGAGAASAEVTHAEPSGFETVNVAHIAAPPDEVYAALLAVGRWWHPDHTWGGDAARMAIEPRAGGCFCERLADGGSVEHLRVTYLEPGKLLRMRGALGPLQEYALQGAQTWRLEPDNEDGTKVTLTYRVSGTVEGGLEGWAGAVDGVHAQQLGRLESLVETGQPDR